MDRRKLPPQDEGLAADVADLLREAPRCSAHGKTAIEHIDGYANDCTATPPITDGSPSDECTQCETYQQTGMHWDTCPNRGRNSRGTPIIGDDGVQVDYAAIRSLAERWQREAERLKKENDVLQAELKARPSVWVEPEVLALARCVAELEPLARGARRRAMAYLTARYAEHGWNFGGLIPPLTGKIDA